MSLDPKTVVAQLRNLEALMSLRLVLSALLLMSLQGFSDPRSFAATKTVDIHNFSFSPSTVTINQGDSVRWVWVEGMHSTTSGTCSGGTCTPNGVWSSPIQSDGEFTFTFQTPGTYPYYCAVHGARMRGHIVVAGPAPLTAEVSASSRCGIAPLETTFTGSATGGREPYQFQWDFGDSSGSTEQNPMHTYQTSGVFTASLQVTDADSTADSATVLVTVSDVALATISQVKTLTGPFRLAISGSDFPETCSIEINGQPVPSSKCVSSTKVLALKGSALKAMVPLNQSVTVTVRPNNCCQAYCPFTFTRTSGHHASHPDPYGDSMGGHPMPTSEGQQDN